MQMEMNVRPHAALLWVSETCVWDTIDHIGMSFSGISTSGTCVPLPGNWRKRRRRQGGPNWRVGDGQNQVGLYKLYNRGHSDTVTRNAGSSARTTRRLSNKIPCPRPQPVPASFATCCSHSRTLRRVLSPSPPSYRRFVQTGAWDPDKKH